MKTYIFILATVTSSSTRKISTEVKLALESCIFDTCYATFLPEKCSYARVKYLSRRFADLVE